MKTQKKGIKTLLLTGMCDAGMVRNISRVKIKNVVFFLDIKNIEDQK